MTRAEPATTTAAEAAPESGFRRRLLDAMAEAIRERGYRDATVADVVRAARTSRRTFYEHFTSKQDCFIALLTERNSETIQRIYDAVDPRAPWRTQVRQAIEAWIEASKADRTVTLAWIRDTPALGEDARRLHREAADAFVGLIQNLTATPEFGAPGVHRATRRTATILYGGYRELIASAVEDGEDVSDLVEVAVETAIALLGPRYEADDRE
ncbi:transcriptional regulator, TetR family [Nocardia amikacinitolerans]|uniref:TetR/AcrR family transcriptional regulator n=1 Tax=Nocardia amikacinitolerans TaxID=756689 RepID=UPI000AFA8751|nr:TetR/AcrR family transcriptional regulator [Nocardia amikacinitolerans]MCP2315689.1 transcriptional regulator, TetR family [Nocardia amikacinitolerans]